VAGLLRAEVVADGRLADPAALLDDDGAPDPEKIKAAVSALLARKPHYAKRISGDVGQGARPGPADPNAELWRIIQSPDGLVVVVTVDRIRYLDDWAFCDQKRLYLRVSFGQRSTRGLGERPEGPNDRYPTRLRPNDV
jgi:hypothetical protein